MIVNSYGSGSGIGGSRVDDDYKKGMIILKLRSLLSLHQKRINSATR